MRGTHIFMTSRPHTDHPILDELDEALVHVRRVLQRPGYRRRLLAAVDRPLELATLRTLRAVERRQDGDPCIGDVAEALAVDPSTASRTVDRAVAAGLLDRTPSERDRRRTSLVLTAQGAAVLDRVTAARRELLAEVTADWADADVERLSALLRDLLVGFDRLEAAP